MAVDLTPDALIEQMRLGDTPEELATATQLLAVATEMVEKHAPAAPTVIMNQAAVAVCSYLFDRPFASRYSGYANIGRNSGMASMLLPYRIHTAGVDAVAAAQEAVGTPGNPVIGLAVVGGQLVVTFTDGTTQSLDLPAGETPETPINPQAGIQIEAVKEFARTGNDTPPTPADLAPDPMSGRVLGLRTAGGTLETSWNQLSAGSPHFVLSTIPTPEQQAIGGLLSQGGVVLVRETDNHPTQLWVRISPAFALVLFHVFSDPLIEVDANGQLPPAVDFQGREAIAGNFLFRSVDTGTSPTFKEYGPGRVVLSGEPVRSPQELIYAGNFASPPAGHYVVNAVAWDWGSEVWLQNQTNDDDDWASYSGPLGYHHGSLYTDEAQAAKHIGGVEDEGRVVVYGHSSGQKPYIVTDVPTATERWEWVMLGVTPNDINLRVMAHGGDPDAHPDIRSITPGAISEHNAMDLAHGAAIALHSAGNPAQPTHPDIRALIAALQSAGGVTFAAYSATASYSYGGANSFVTHGNKIYFYRATVTHSSAHDPGQHPGLWLNLTEGVTYQIIVAGAQRVSARTICVFDDTDEIFLCTTTQNTPRDKAYIRAQAGSIGGAFIQIGYAMIPRAKLPPVREWTLNEDYRKGEIVDTTGAGHVHFIALVDNNSSSIQNRKQPGTPGGVGTWDQLFTADNPPPASSGVPNYTELATLSAGGGNTTFTANAAGRAAIIAGWGSTYYAMEIAFEWELTIQGNPWNFHSRDVVFCRPAVLADNESHIFSVTFDDNSTGSPYFERLEINRTGAADSVQVLVGTAVNASATCKIYGVS